MFQIFGLCGKIHSRKEKKKHIKIYTVQVLFPSPWGTSKGLILERIAQSWIFVPELPNSNHSVIPKVGLLEKVMILGQQCSVFDLGVYFTQFLLYRKVFMHHKCNYLQRKLLVYCPTFFVWTVNVCLSIGLYVCTELHYNDILFQN